MSKKIFSACLLVLVVLSCSLTAFCADNSESSVIAVKSADYNDLDKKITLTIENTGNEDIADSVLQFDYNESEIKINNYQGGIMTGEIAAGAAVDIILSAEVTNFTGNLPQMGFVFQYITATGGTIDLSQESASSVKMVTVQNIFADMESAGGVSLMKAIGGFLGDTGFALIANNWKVLIMILISFVLMYLAIVKKFEPLLLLPIAFGMLLTNLPGAGMYNAELFADGHVHWEMFGGKGNITPGLLDYLYLGVKLGIYPCLIFIGVGAMTDFGPLIANPKSLLLGAAAQLGIFLTFFGTRILFGFSPFEAASTGIIGGADGPTAIFVTSKLAPELLGPIAVAAYSYMALVPVIQPPIMKLLTTKKERMIEMKQLREVSKTEKIIFPIVVTAFVSLLLPSAAALIGSLMLGNLLRECGVAERLSKTVQNELMNIVTVFLGISVGATATADIFLTMKTIQIIIMGVVAFGFGTAGGVLLAKIMNLFLKNKINPLIGSAGVSAVPMAARVSQVVGQKENPKNFLLMHAMGPNVAGVIGSAIAAGAFLTLFMR